MTFCPAFRVLGYSCCSGIIITEHLYSPEYTYLDGHLYSEVYYYKHAFSL